MLPKTGAADIYTDFNGLAQLRSQAKTNSSGALREAANQFEALFLQETLKSMRSASPGDRLMDNKQSQFYRDMHDQQLAIHLAKNSNLGLSNMLVKQLGDEVGTEGKEAGKTLADYRHHAVPRIYDGEPGEDSEDAQGPVKFMEQLIGQTAKGAKPGRDATPAQESAIASREGFINTLWPHAKAAAEELGVDPKLLLAQAALETGWGKSLLRSSGSTHSHNVFGIKADKSWQGERVVKTTLEYDRGTMMKNRAAFRAYKSFADSFKDYVSFVQSNPRYAKALANAGNPQAYVHSLQQAGYATDPQYARKILSIARHESFSNLV